MEDSPSLAFPHAYDPTASGPFSNAPLKTGSAKYSFDVMVATRTLDTQSDAHKLYFEQFKTSWAVNYSWPYAKNVNIVKVSTSFSRPSSATEIDVNVVSSIIGQTAPFGTWVPSSPWGMFSWLNCGMRLKKYMCDVKRRLRTSVLCV